MRKAKHSNPHTLEIRLKPAQMRVFACTKRFRVLVAGRRFGKTYLALVELLRAASDRDRLVWYVAPSYKQGKRIAWNRLKRLTKPYWTSEERWMARFLLTLVIALNLGQVYLSVLFNDWNARFYDSLQEKNLHNFYRELIIFSVLAFSYIIVGVYQYYLRQMLYIRWRRWLTARYQRNWLANRVYYRMELAQRATDNPDQRIQEDLGNFTDQTLRLGLDAMSSAVTLFSFFLILWNLSGPLDLDASGTVGAPRRDPRADAEPPAPRDRWSTPGRNHQG